MSNDTELLEIEKEIDVLMGEAEREFRRGVPLEQSIDRVFVRLSDRAVRLLAVRGMAMTAEHAAKHRLCDACGAEIEE